MIEKVDSAVYSLIEAEKERQKFGLELIPSENYVSEAVLDALGSCFTNKYSEGYPGKRYYGGQQFTDEVESLAIARAKELFHAQFANVQPLSGAPANLAAYSALLQPGDTILGMDLSHGGHLTHGHPMTLPSKIYNFVAYKTVDGEIDYDSLWKLAEEHKPQLILAGFSSYPGDINYNVFRNVADQVGAKLMMDMAHIAGLVAAGVKENPLDFGFDVVTTTTHKTLRGPRGGLILTNNEELAKKIDKAVFPGIQGGPHMNNIAAKAVAFYEALQPGFKGYARQVLLNADAMVSVFKEKDVKMIAGGTSNHLIVIDVTEFGLTGKEAEKALDEVGITVNKNVIPDDPRGALDPSGIRLGTPAITSRGFTEDDCKRLATIIVETLAAQTDTSREERAEIVRYLDNQVRQLALKNPVPERYDIN